MRAWMVILKGQVTSALSISVPTDLPILAFVPSLPMTGFGGGCRSLRASALAGRGYLRPRLEFMRRLLKGSAQGAGACSAGPFPLEIVPEPPANALLGQVVGLELRAFAVDILQADAKRAERQPSAPLPAGLHDEEAAVGDLLPQIGIDGEEGHPPGWAGLKSAPN